MAFRPKAKQPQFADLKGILAQSRKELDNATYQTIVQIIDRLGQLQHVINDQFLTEEDANEVYASKDSSFITSDDESASLPNSRQLLAGTNVTLDDSVANQLTINVSSAAIGAEWSVLTNGVVDNPELIFASGDVIMTHIP